MTLHPREFQAEQGSDEWHRERYGRITGSIVGEIMPGKRGGIPAGRKKLLYRKAVEFMAQVDESTDIPARYANWGHEWEPEACDAVEKYLNENELSDPVSFRKVGIISAKFNPLCASSLDRISNGFCWAMEVKCPYYMYSHIKHIKERPVVNLMSGTSEKNYYWQARLHMLVSGAQFCAWGTYHPMFAPNKLHVEIIERKQDEMDLLEEHCSKFIEDMKELCREVLR